MQLTHSKIVLTILLAVNLSLGSVSDAEVLIPERDEWSPPKEIVGLRLGGQGSWDDSPPGAITPCTVVKLSGTYYLYYIGSDGKRAHDKGPAHRKLGLATSSNGIDFTRYDGNPILSWSPANNDEEGIFGAKAIVVDDRILLYLNTMSAKNARTDQVWADIHLVTSRDGKHFSRPILVLDHSNPSVVGYGDELGPTGISHSNGKWSLYYFAKGIHISAWRLCLATGDSSTSFVRSKLLLEEPAFYGSGGDIHWLSDTKSVMFFQKRSNWERIEVYTASAETPDKLSKARTWDGFAGGEGITVFLDKEREKWFLYSREANKTFVRTAPIRHDQVSDHREDKE
ncbi:MAG: hypothetical protein KJ804_21220 [Proteobacteria bacterium]|nr:hypothetical protein [Pseudomonadota bacterium]MBU1060832.1 hypothetical protein [Pseudomonadota bacterium]